MAFLVVFLTLFYLFLFGVFSLLFVFAAFFKCVFSWSIFVSFFSSGKHRLAPGLGFVLFKVTTDTWAFFSKKYIFLFFCNLL